MVIKEKHIQAMCINHLKLLEKQGRLYFFRSGAGALKTIRQNGSEGFFKTGKAGLPDITVCYKGQFIGLEIKTEIGGQSPIQKLAQTQIEAVGGLYFIIRTADQLIQLFKTI